MSLQERETKVKINKWECISFIVVQLLSHVWLFATPWTAVCQASCPSLIYLSLLKLMSIDLVIPSNHLIFCHRLLLLPSVFPSIRVFFKESVLHIRWPKYWSFCFSISPSNEHSGLISFRGHSEVFCTTIPKHQFSSAQPSLWSNSHIRTWLLEKL